MDWFQTVKAVALSKAAHPAPTSAIQRSVTKELTMRWATRNMKPAAAALVAAANTLIRTATDSPNGASSRLKTRASTTKSGFPGG